MKTVEIRCGQCSKKLAEADYRHLSIKCPRCGTFNVLKAASPQPERPGASPRKETHHASSSNDL
ncbi:MAG: Com family DNA-binding transcriptional regulator [Betaproteobacteria bacterium]|nr:Com family DNA-binding transcriptional regulator [Betaproteobacteria bacterium]